jgi:3-hydroxyacyl-CoA dehydrogenase
MSRSATSDPFTNDNDPASSIQTATVIGAGTMGAAIAAHLANAGLSVYLLDISDEAVNAGFERMRAARPAALFTPQTAERITLGNLEDHLVTYVSQSDWIIEAIIEKLEPKQQLMARIEKAAPPHAIISTNTSGLLIREIAQDRAPEFQRRFLGTHFFNPPRYLYLLEVIPTAATDPAIIDQISDFARHALGKGVVVCKDTPNFIANRMISFIIAHLMEYAVAHGYTVEEVDYLAGPLIGRPRSGLFRLLDVIGIDVMALINRNLYDLIPHDTDRATLRGPLHTAVWQTLMDAGHLGAKSGQGFYKTVTEADGSRAFWSLHLAAAARGEIDYTPPQAPDFPAFDALRRAPLGQRLRAVIDGAGNTSGDTSGDSGDSEASAEETSMRGAAIIRQTVYQALVYAARRIPEMADSLADIDRVMRWGFLWEQGPFEMWDALGVQQTIDHMTAAGMDPPAWVLKMVAQGNASFYKQAGQELRVYDPATEAYQPLPGDTPPLDMPAVYRHASSVYANDSATLYRLPPDPARRAHADLPPLLLLEFHSKLNALDAGSLDVLEAARDALHADSTAVGSQDSEAPAGLLIANAGTHFCVGANLQEMLAAAQAQQWDELADFIRRGQYLFLALRRAAKPVVAAPFQRVLGGGVEVCLAAHRVMAQAETYMGLVETGVGLIPGWGGCKELVRRHVRPATRGEGDARLPKGLAHVFETIVQGKVSTSAADAQRLGYLAPKDEIVMNPGLLLETARDQVYARAELDYSGTPAQEVYAAGRDGLDVLYAQIEAAHEAEKFSDYDRLIARKLAYVLCGGDGAPGWQSEEFFLDLEREAFVSLAGEAKTQERMAHMLRAGQPLRN